MSRHLVGSWRRDDTHCRSTHKPARWHARLPIERDELVIPEPFGRPTRRHETAGTVVWAARMGTRAVLADELSGLASVVRQLQRQALDLHRRVRVLVTRVHLRGLEPVTYQHPPTSQLGPVGHPGVTAFCRSACTSPARANAIHSMDCLPRVSTSVATPRSDSGAQTSRTQTLSPPVESYPCALSVSHRRSALRPRPRRSVVEV